MQIVLEFIANNPTIIETVKAEMVLSNLAEDVRFVTIKKGSEVYPLAVLNGFPFPARFFFAHFAKSLVKNDKDARVMMLSATRNNYKEIEHVADLFSAKYDKGRYDFAQEHMLVLMGNYMNALRAKKMSMTDFSKLVMDIDDMYTRSVTNAFEL